MRRRLAVILEYRGGRYCGFQVQPQLPTVQGELERALEALYGEHVKTYGASRTDAGAHARGQVAAFDAPRDYPPRAVMGALNASLPGDVRVREAFEAPGGFDPRRQAASREYRYLVLNQERPSVFWRGYAWHVAQFLDVEAMQQAADGLLGCHDFRAFAGPIAGPAAEHAAPGLSRRRSAARRRGDLRHGGGGVPAPPGAPERGRPGPGGEGRDGGGVIPPAHRRRRRGGGRARPSGERPVSRAGHLPGGPLGTVNR